MPNPAMAVRVVTNLDDLRKNLAEGKNIIDVTTASMQKLAASLDGSKLEQRAHTIVGAIDSIGGATKLTDAEAQRHLGTLNAWIEKAGRMGKDVPTDILKTRDALKDLHPPLESTDQLLGKIWSGLKTSAGLIGISFSAEALVGFAGHVFETASNIHDLSAKLGISSEAVQGFKAAAEQSGTTLDAVGGAIVKMNLNLATGDKSTVSALQDAHLSFQALRSMKPEDAFLAIMDAIQQIPDPMEQTRLGAALLGKGFADLIPAMKDGFRQTADAAHKMSDTTVEQLAAAQTAWTKLGNEVVIISGTLIGQTMKSAEQIGSSWGGIAQFAENVIKFGPAMAMSMAETTTSTTKAAVATETLSEADRLAKLQSDLRTEATAQLSSGILDYIAKSVDANKSTAEITLALQKAGLATEADATAINLSVEARKKAITESEKHQKALAEIALAQVPLNEAQKDTIKELDALSVSHGNIAEQLGVSEAAVSAFTDGLKREAKAVEETQKIWNEYAALKIEHSGTATDRQIADINRWAADLTAKMQRAGTDTKEFYEALAALSHEKLDGVQVDWDAVARYSQAGLRDTAERAWATFRAMAEGSGGASREVIDHFRAIAEAAEADARGWSSPWGGAMDAVANGADRVAQNVRKIAEEAKRAAEEAAKFRNIGNTLDLEHAARDPEIMQLLHEGWSLENATKIKMARQWGFEPKLYDKYGNPESQPSAGERVPGYASGILNAPGGWAMVGERGPELLQIPRGSNVYPSGSAAGGVTIQAINITVNGSVLSNDNQLAAVVGDAFMQRLRAMGTRLPSGA